MGGVLGHAEEEKGKEEQMCRSSSSDIASVEASANCTGVLSSGRLIAVPCSGERMGVYTFRLASPWMCPHQKGSDPG